MNFNFIFSPLAFLVISLYRTITTSTYPTYLKVKIALSDQAVVRQVIFIRFILLKLHKTYFTSLALNIYSQITKTDQTKVADLGLATIKNQITGTYCGTPLYMAPEISPDQKIYDSKVDMYSFGVMMWEMWFGERVRSKPTSWSQDEVTRKIDERKQRGEGRGGRRHPPPTKWIELMVSLWDYDPCVRKTAMESEVLIKEIKQFVKKAE